MKKKSVSRCYSIGDFLPWPLFESTFSSNRYFAIARESNFSQPLSNGVLILCFRPNWRRVLYSSLFYPWTLWHSCSEKWTRSVKLRCGGFFSVKWYSMEKGRKANRYKWRPPKKNSTEWNITLQQNPRHQGCQALCWGISMFRFKSSWQNS